MGRTNDEVKIVGDADAYRRELILQSAREIWKTIYGAPRKHRKGRRDAGRLGTPTINKLIHSHACVPMCGVMSACVCIYACVCVLRAYMGCKVVLN